MTVLFHFILDLLLDFFDCCPPKRRAGKLVDGLAGEKIRWTESLGKFDVQQLATVSVLVVQNFPYFCI